MQTMKAELNQPHGTHYGTADGGEVDLYQYCEVLDDGTAALKVVRTKKSEGCVVTCDYKGTWELVGRKKRIMVTKNDATHSLARQLAHSCRTHSCCAHSVRCAEPSTHSLSISHID